MKIRRGDFRICVFFIAILLFAGCASETRDTGSIPYMEDDTALLNETGKPDDYSPAEERHEGKIAPDNETQMKNKSGAGLTSDAEQAADLPEPIASETAKHRIIMIHNNRGPMCIEQLEFLESLDLCPNLELEEHYTYRSGTEDLLDSLISEHASSVGVSSEFGYLPITFINRHAYSGFNTLVKDGLLRDIGELCK